MAGRIAACKTSRPCRWSLPARAGAGSATVCPVNVPPERALAAAELLTRINYDLVIGNFEMDLGDGEIRYKTGLDVTGADLSLPLVQNAVYLNVLMMDTYLPAIMAVAYGDVSPLEALSRIGGPAEPEPSEQQGA